MKTSNAHLVMSVACGECHHLHLNDSIATLCCVYFTERGTAQRREEGEGGKGGMGKKEVGRDREREYKVEITRREDRNR